MVTWIAALQHGATEADLALLYDAVTPIITKLMGREALYEWSLQQLVQAVLKRSAPSDYESYVRGLVASGRIDLSSAESAHTAEFLASCDADKPRPPAAYFKKLGMLK